MKVWRDGHIRRVTLELEELQSDELEVGEKRAREGLLGKIAVQDLTPEIARQLDLPKGLEGVVVGGVEPGSAWQTAGLRRGDLIEEVNRRAVASKAAFEHEVEKADGSLLLLVRRGEGSLFVVVEPN